MASSDTYLTALPDDIDHQILAYVAQLPAVTTERVIRDIARLICIRRLLDTTVLNEDVVLCGGMAMRCLRSTRYSVYDTDTSAKRPIDDATLAAAITFSDDDIAITPGGTRDWTENKGVRTARPIHFRADFTQLDPGDATFSLSVSTRGLERPAQWVELIHGYPFPLWGEADRPRVPIMDPLEMLAEKLVAWWLFGNAKHLFDIAFLSDKVDLHHDDDAPALPELIERKLAANLKLGAATQSRVRALTDAARRERLETPLEWLDPDNGFRSIAYVGPQPLHTDMIVSIVRERVVPLLWS